MYHKYFWKLQWCAMCNAMLLFTGSLFILLNCVELRTLEQFDPTMHLSQILTDWDHKPFVNIQLLNATECPENMEPVFYKWWYGISDGCLYRTPFDTKSRYSDQTYGIEWNRDCRLSGLQEDSIEVNSVPPVLMDNFDGFVICGTRASRSFKDVIRPDISTNQCPQATRACSDESSVDNKICIPDQEKLEEQCPITWMKVIKTADYDQELASLGLSNSDTDLEKQGSSEYQNTWLNVRQFTWQFRLLYSNKADSLPVSSYKVETQPCMDQQYTSGEIITNKEDDAVKIYPAELNPNPDNQTTCQQEFFSGLDYDPRYTDIGFDTNRLWLEQDNKVFQLLRQLPDYQWLGPTENEKSKIIYKFWTRNTLEWKLACDVEEGTSRLDILRFFADNQHLFEQKTESIIQTTAIVEGIVFLNFAFIVIQMHIVCCKNGCGRPFYKSFKKYLTNLILKMILIIPIGLVCLWEIFTLQINTQNRITDSSYTILNGCSDQYINKDIEDMRENFAFMEEKHFLNLILSGCQGALIIIELLLNLIYLTKQKRKQQDQVRKSQTSIEMQSEPNISQRQNSQVQSASDTNGKKINLKTASGRISVPNSKIQNFEADNTSMNNSIQKDGSNMDPKHNQQYSAADYDSANDNISNATRPLRSDIEGGMQTDYNSDALVSHNVNGKVNAFATPYTKVAPISLNSSDNKMMVHSDCEKVSSMRDINTLSGTENADLRNSQTRNSFASSLAMQPNTKTTTDLNKVSVLSSIEMVSRPIRSSHGKRLQLPPINELAKKKKPFIIDEDADADDEDGDHKKQESNNGNQDEYYDEEY